MSIATRIESIEEHIEQAYDELQGLGADLTNVNKNIENISIVLDDIYDSMPQVSGEGTSLTLDDTRVGKIKSTLKGNTSQSGTPTPTTPISVNVVSGDNEIQVCGKNFFEIKEPDYKGQDAWNGYGVDNVYTIIDNGFTFNAKYCGIGWKFNNLIVGEQYTLSFDYEGNKTFWADVGVNEYAAHTEANASLKSYSVSTTKKREKFTFTAAATNRVAFNSGYTDNTTLTISNIQLEKGSTASTYEPYQGNTYNIDLPVENLFEVTPTSSGVTSGITYNKVDENTFTITSSYDSSSWARADITLPNALLQNTDYTMKVNFTSTNISITTIRFSFRKADSTEVTYQDLSSGGTITFNTGSNIVTFIRIYVATSTGISPSTITFTNLELEKGSKITGYSPYGTTPIELCKIGNYQDYFYKDSGKWYLHKEIGKVVLDGTQTLTYELALGLDMFKYTNNDMLKGNILDGYCNYYENQKNIGSDIYQDGEFRLGWSSKVIYFMNDTSRFNGSLQNFNTWLASHNVVVYYVLATPVNTALEDM